MLKIGCVTTGNQFGNVRALLCAWALWADSMKGLWFQLGHKCNLIWYLRSRVQMTGIQGYHSHHGGIQRLSEWHSVRCCWHGNMSELLHTRLSYMHFATVLLCSVLSWPPTRSCYNWCGMGETVNSYLILLLLLNTSCKAVKVAVKPYLTPHHTV